MQDYKYYIAGEFKTSDKKIEVVNPATEEPIASIYEAGPDDIDKAIQSARNALSLWRKTSYSERAYVLREIAQVITNNLSVLAELESKESGKALKESLFVDIPLAAECFKYYASFLESLEEESLNTPTGPSRISYEPFGVCGIYLPYNTPLMIFGFSCAAALAAANAIIIKPSEYGSLSLLELVRHIDKLDIPKGLINVITGKGETVGSFLAQSPLDFVSFTGSRSTLQKVISQSAGNPKKIICELGGCNLSVVFSDANLGSAIENILASSFMKQGQMCIGTSVALIDKEIYKQFIRGLVAKAENIKIGDPFDAAVGLGPLVTKEHLLAVDRKVEDVVVRGGKILTGGEIIKRQGYFYKPTVIEISEMIYEEFFAPVVLVKSFKDSQELQQIIDANPTGLVMQIWTNDLDAANSLAQSSRCGTVWVNTFAQMTPQTPFGGIGQSGWGRNLGKAGFFEYVQPKHIGIGFKKSPVEGWFGV